MSKFFDEFIQAQSPIYPLVLQELTQGKKRTHWMWFIFPQIQGLGHSEIAQRYALENLMQAQDYLQHEVLPVLFMRALKVTHFRQLDDPLTVFGLEGTIFGSVFTLSA